MGGGMLTLLLSCSHCCEREHHAWHGVLLGMYKFMSRRSGFRSKVEPLSMKETREMMFARALSDLIAEKSPNCFSANLVEIACPPEINSGALKPG
jgi:hypothetical protein